MKAVNDGAKFQISRGKHAKSIKQGKSSLAVGKARTEQNKSKEKQKQRNKKMVQPKSNNNNNSNDINYPQVGLNDKKKSTNTHLQEAQRKAEELKQMKKVKDKHKKR